MWPGTVRVPHEPRRCSYVLIFSIYLFTLNLVYKVHLLVVGHECVFQPFPAHTHKIHDILELFRKRTRRRKRRKKITRQISIGFDRFWKICLAIVSSFLVCFFSLFFYLKLVNGVNSIWLDNRCFAIPCVLFQ